MRQRPFRIAEFSIDPLRNVITAPQGESSVEPKIMEVLCALASRPGHVFSRGELIDLVWGKSYGADESLTRAISQLRKVFGDSRDEARVLETIQKRGYRLIAPVSDMPAAEETIVAPAAAPRISSRWRVAALFILGLAGAGFWWLTAHRAPDRMPPPQASVPADATGISVSLAPFAHEAGERGQAALASAIQAGLITNMSRVSLLHLDADSAAPVKRNLRYRIEGSVQRAGNRTRVNVRLISASDGVHVWAANFDRGEASTGLPLQDEFTAAITSELISRILISAKEALRKRQIESLAPWELILLGTGIPGSDEVFLVPHTKDAFWLQRRALAMDPNYAPAHALLANALAYHALFNPPEDNPAALAEAERHAQIAIAKAPYTPEVLYLVSTYYRLRAEREKSLQMLRRILEIHPGDIQANIDLPFVDGQCSANADAAIARLEAIERTLLPGNPIRRVLLSHLADIYLSKGAFVQARDTALASRTIVQTGWSGITLAAAQAQLGQSSDALRVSAETRREWPNLDFRHFANRMVPRWCFGGPVAAHARQAFQSLDRLERQAR